MIQRIQTLYLLLSTAAAFTTLFLPVASIEVGGMFYSISLLNVEPAHPSQSSAMIWLFTLSGLVAVSGLIFFYSVYQFKRRKFQMRMVRTAIFVSVIYFGLSFFMIDQIIQSLSSGLANSKYDVGVYMPIVFILLGWLALNAIRKDDELIRSADRLR